LEKRGDVPEYYFVGSNGKIVDGPFWTAEEANLIDDHLNIKGKGKLLFGYPKNGKFVKCDPETEEAM
jgi:hypothetical protein